MTTQDYLSRIIALNSEENSIENNCSLVLEKIVVEIAINNNRHSFILSDLFIKSDKSNMVFLNNEIINQIADYLGLIFINEEELDKNICFANNDELRSKYKQSFRMIDLLDYVFAFLHSKIYRESTNIIIASETELFWKLIKIGTSLRNSLE